MKFLNGITNAFPIIIIVASAASLYNPELFAWFTNDYITIGLGIIMLGMGLTLKTTDFLQIFRMPLWVITGLALQFAVMPFLGWFLAQTFNLPPFLATGLILVSCCPGGTASNVITYLSRGNVALSVCLTAFSTLMAIVLTPVLTAVLAGSKVDVDAAGLFLNTLQVVLLPVTAGALMNRFLPDFTKKAVAFAPPVAVIFITLIVSSIIGGGKEIILDSAPGLFMAVILLHFSGFTAGYLVSKIFLKKEDVARAIAIEVGMQNSGLGALLAKKNFPDPATAIPSALSSLTHCILGSAFAWIARKFPVQEQVKFTDKKERVGA
ncbi:bile acid:sodium symporter family protein [Cytophagaceae bacterium ABcell3]|nr:bile acid:sodium symporter family protein [Cytophagaceae bacterium ABcell3]